MSAVDERIATVAIAGLTGLEVYANCFSTLAEAFGAHGALPQLRADVVAAGRHGTKNGKGITGDCTPEELDELVATAASRTTGCRPS